MSVYEELLIASSYKMEDGSIGFSKWINYAEATKEEKEKCTHRSVRFNEIILDIDRETTDEAKKDLTIILDDLKKQKYEFKAYFTGSKGFHIHLTFEDLEKQSDEQRKKIKEYFITKYGCDKAKATMKCLIAWENKPHWKTGNKKTLIEEHEGNNDTRKLIKEYEEKIKEEEELKKTDPTIIGFQALQLLNKNQRRACTELIVKTFLSINKVYTTRDDEKSEMWIYHRGIYIPQAKTHIKEYTRTLLGEAYTTTIGNEIIAKIEADTYIEIKDFFEVKNIELIAVENGILNLKTKALTPHTPNLIFFNKLPVVYDPTKKCPKIIKFIQEILQCETDAAVIQEIFGYLLWREYFIEKAFMFTGTGRNGKSKLVEIMRRFVGFENCTNISLSALEEDPYSKGELFQKMANIGADISNTYLKDLSWFKGLTGRDTISCQRKFLTNISYVNFAKMIFNANELPNSRDKTPAFWHRWIVITFKYTFLTQKEYDLQKDNPNVKLADENIVETLTTPEEMSGLLNYALEGLEHLRTWKSFSYNKSTAEVEDLWLRKSSSINAFIKDKIKYDSNSYLTKDEFRRAYAEYCVKHKIKSVDDIKIKYAIAEIGAYEEIKRFSENEEHWRERVYQCIDFIQVAQPTQATQPFDTYTKNSNYQLSSKNPVPPEPPVPPDFDEELVVDE